MLGFIESGTRGNGEPGGPVEAAGLRSLANGVEVTGRRRSTWTSRQCTWGLVRAGRACVLGEERMSYTQ